MESYIKYYNIRDYNVRKEDIEGGRNFECSNADGYYHSKYFEEIFLCQRGLILGDGEYERVRKLDIKIDEKRLPIIEPHIAEE